ncbi:MAG TPA: AraC family transcriptional regulator [Segetibacter sp.]
MKLYIKYMVSQRCKMLVKEELKTLGVQSQYIIVDLGLVEILEDITEQQRDQLKKNLLISGLELLDDSKSILIEKIINGVMDLIHYTDEPPSTNYSDYLSKRLDYDYTYLANIFSEVKGMTLQQFIIIQKIERAKELLLYEELNLTKIASKLHYSSVAHLSNQFKKITGLTPTFFKQLKQKRVELENV